MSSPLNLNDGTQAVPADAISSATIAAHLEDLLRKRREIDARLAELEDRTRSLLNAAAADEAAFGDERHALAENPQFLSILQRSRDRAQVEGTLSVDEVRRLLD